MTRRALAHDLAVYLALLLLVAGGLKLLHEATGMTLWLAALRDAPGWVGAALFAGGWAVGAAWWVAHGKARNR